MRDNRFESFPVESISRQSIYSAMVRAAGVTALCLAVALWATPALAGDGTWDGGGSQAWGTAIWGGATNWVVDYSPAGDTDATVFFGVAFANGYSVNVNTQKTIGHIRFTDPAGANDLILARHTNDYTLTLNVTTGSPTINVTQSGRTLTINPRVGGSDGLTKIGPGTLILAGEIIYTGATIVDAGTLVISGSPTGISDVTVNAGGTLKLDYSALNTGKIHDSTILTLGGGTLNLAGGSHTEIVASTTLADGGASRVTRSTPGSVLQMGDITRGAGATIDVGASGIATTNHTNTNGIIAPWATVAGTDWAVNSTGGANGPITAYTTYTDLQRLTPGTIANGATTNVRIIEGSGSAGSILLGAATTTIHTLNQSAVGGSSGTTIDPAGRTLLTNAILVGTGAGALTIGTGTNNGTLSAAAAGGELILINNTANALTINSVIADNSTSALIKAGAGTLLLAGANTYTGATTVSAGILRADDNAGLPGLSSTGGGSYLNLAGGVFETGANLERSGAGTAAGNMRITGGNSGFSAYGAPVQVAFGTIASPDALTWGTAPFQPGTFILNAASANNTIEFLNGVNLGNTARTVQVDASVATMSGVISSTGTLGGLTKTGAGTLVLSNASNSYTGATAVIAGTLRSGASNVLPDASAVTVSGTGAGVTAILDLNGYSDTIGSLTLGGSTDTSGAAVTTGAGTLTLNGNVTYSYAGKPLANANNPLGATISGKLDLGSANRTFTINDSTTAAADLTVSADISGGVGLTKAGAGTLVLSGTNSYTGTTTVNANAGVLQFNSVAAIGGSGRNVTVNSGATVAFGPSFGSIQSSLNNRIAAASAGAVALGADSSENLDFSDSGANLTAASLGTVGTVNYTGTLTPNGTIYRLGGPGGTLIMANTNAVTGSGYSLAVKGNVILSGTNDYTGGTSLDAGTLGIGNEDALGSGQVTFNGGGISSDSATALSISKTLTFTGNGGVGDAVNTGKVTFTGAVGLGASTRTLTVNSDAEFTNVISGTGAGLTKAGSGTLILSNASNSYTGATTVNAGTLRSGASNVLPDTAVTVSGNAAGVTATLDLSGYSDTIGSLTLGGSAGSSSTTGSTTTSGSAVTTGTGTLTLGGDVTYSNTNNPLGATISGKLDLGSANRAFTINDSTTATDDLTVSADISGTDVGLAKAGAGTLILSGTNTYSGTTTINAGAIQFNSTAAIAGPGSADLTVNAGGTIAFGPSFGAGNIPGVLSGRVTSNSEGTIAADNYGSTNFDFNAAGLTAASLGAVASVTYTGTLTPNGTTYRLGGGGGTLIMANTNAITGAGKSLTVNGNVVLAAANDFGGGTSLTAGILGIGNDGALGSGTVTFKGGGLSSDSTTPRSVANTVAFDANAAYGTIGHTVNAGKLTFSGTVDLGSTTPTLTIDGDVEFTGATSGAAGIGLTKAGNGTLTLSGANTYTGTTTVSAGTLAYGVDNAIAARDITVSGGTLDIGTFSDTVGLVTLTGGEITGTAGVLTSTADFAVRAGTISATLGGSTGLTKTTTGTATLSGASTYTGVTTIAGGGGILAVANLADGGSPSGIGQSSNAAANLLIGNAGVLQYTGDTASTDRLFTINGTAIGHNATVDASGTGVISFTNTGNLAFGTVDQTWTLILAGTNTGDNSIAAVIVDNGKGVTSLTKSGAGTWVLASANTYTGLTSITGGTLVYGVDDAIGTGAVTVNGAGAVLAMGSYSDSVGAVTLTAGDITGTGTLTSTGGFTMNNAAAASVSVVLDGSVGLTKSAAGALTLSAANTYTGTTTVSAGQLNINAQGTGATNSAIGTGMLTINGGTIDAANGAIDLSGTTNNAVTIGGNFTFGGSNGLNLGTGAVTNSGNRTITLNGNNPLTLGPVTNTQNAATTLTVNNGTGTDSDTVLNLAGYALTGGANTAARTTTITGTGNVNITGAVTDGQAYANALTKSGAGTLTLAGTNTYTGATNVNAGTLSLTGALGSGGGTAISSAATFTVSGTGVIAGTSSLTVTAGTTTLAGANTYTGATTVNGGTLTLDYGTQDNTKLSDSAALVLGSGTVELAGGIHTEAVGSTSLTAGSASSVIRSSGGAKLAMGAITSGAGATVSFGAESIATTTRANDSSGILGAWATIGDNWARNDGGGNIVAYTGAYTDIDAKGDTITDGSTTNVRINSEGSSGNLVLSAASTTVNTLLQNTDFAATIDMAGTNTLMTGGIMIRGGMEAVTVGASVGDGTLKAAAAGGTLVLYNNNAAKTLTVNAAIADNSASGLGTSGNVLLNGANTYTGATSIRDGMLEIGSAGRLNSGIYAGAISIADGATVNYNSSGTQTLSGIISGGGALTKGNSGVLTLFVANTFTGGMTLNNGTLTANGNAGALGAGALVLNGGTLDFNHSAALNFGRPTTVGGDVTIISERNAAGAGLTYTLGTLSIDANTLNISGGNVTSGTAAVTFGATTLTGAATFNVTNPAGGGGTTLNIAGAVDNGGYLLTVDGSGTVNMNNIVVSGAGGITKNGAGTLILGAGGTVAYHTYTGTTTINGGVVRFISNNIGSGNLTINEGVLEDYWATTFTRALGTGPGQVQITGGVSGFSGQGSSGVTIRINNDAAYEVVWGSTYFAPDTLVLQAPTVNTNGKLTWQNMVDLDGATRTIAVNQTGTDLAGGYANITGVIRNSDGNSTAGLTKTGPGQLILSGANTYNGPTTISAGTLTISNASTFTNTSRIVLSGTSRLKVNVANQSLAKLVAGGGVPAGTFLQYSQVQTTGGTGPGTILGTVELNVTNVNPNYTLDFGSGSTFKTLVAATYDSPITVSGNASIDASANVLTGGAGMTISASTGGAKTLTLTGTNTGANTIGGVISDGSGTVGVSKTGIGTWTLSGTSTYTGVTTIAASGGTLAVTNLVDGNSPSSIGQSSNAAASLLIGNAGTLKYTGAGASTDRLFTINGTAAGNGATLDASGTGPISFTNTGSLAYGTAGQTRTLTLTGANTGDNSIAAVIANNGAGATSLTKSGAGTWVLAGANTYTGATTVNAGTLRSGASNVLPDASAITVSGTGAGVTATLDLNGYIDTVASLTFGGSTATSGAAVTTGAGTLTLNGNVTYISTNNPLGATISGKLNLGTANRTFTVGDSTTAVSDLTVSAVVSGSGGLIKTGAGVMAFSGANTYTGTTIITAGVLRAVDGTGLPAGSLLQINGGVLESSGTFIRSIGSSPGNVQWNADGGFSAADGTLAVNLGGQLTPLTLDWAAAIGTGLNGKNLIFGSPVANNVVTLANNLDMKGNRTVTVNDNTGTAADYAVISGIIANGDAIARTFTKTGAGTLVLAGSNSYTGTTIITAGALRAVGTALSGSLLQINGGVLETNGTFSRSIGGAAGNVQWNNPGGFSAQGGTLTVKLNNGTGTIDWAGTLTTGLNGKNLIFGSVSADNVVTLTNSLDMKGAVRTITVNDNISTTADYAVISGVISNSTGAQGLTKAGTGTLVLTGANTYTGLTTVSAGTLTLTGDNTAATGGVTLTAGALNVNSATALGTGTVILTAGTLDNTSGSAKTLTTNNAVTIGGNFTFGGTNALDLGTGAVTNSGSRTITLNGDNPLTLGAMTNTQNAATTLTVNNGTGTGSSTVLNLASYALTGGANTAARTTTITGTGNVNITGAVTNGQEAYANALTKSGAGRLSLSGASTYTGATTVSAGILRADDNAGLPGLSSSGGGSYLNLAGGILETGANLERAGGAGQGQMQITSGTSGFSAYGAPVQVAFGTLASPAALTWGTAPFIPGTFVLNAATANNTIDFMNSINLVNTARTVQVNANVATMSGVISGTGTTGGLIKTGNGTLVLSGVNSYPGATTVSAGTLLVNGNQALATGAVTVQSSATLGGTGVIGGTVTVEAGHLSPGAGIGTLSTGSVTMADGAIYDMEIGATTADNVVVAGNVTFVDTWQVVLANGGGGAPKATDTFDLFTYTGEVVSLGTPSISAGFTDWIVTGATIVDDGINRVYITGIASMLPGDTNGDLVVDAVDFINLKKNFGLGGGVGVGNFDGDSTVDWDDLSTLAANMGTGGPAPATTPEPATLGLLAIGALAVLRRRRAA